MAALRHLQSQQQLRANDHEKVHGIPTEAVPSRHASSDLNSRAAAHSAASKSHHLSPVSFAIPRLPLRSKFSLFRIRREDRNDRFRIKTGREGSSTSADTSLAAAATGWLKALSLKRFASSKNRGAIALPPPPRVRLVPSFGARISTTSSSSLPVDWNACNVGHCALDAAVDTPQQSSPPVSLSQPSPSLSSAPETQQQLRNQATRKRSSLTSRSSTASESSVAAGEGLVRHDVVLLNQKREWRVTRWNVRRTGERRDARHRHVDTPGGGSPCITIAIAITDNQRQDCRATRVRALVLNLLRSTESFEGFVCARILQRQQFPASSCPLTCRRYLNKVRDCVQDLVHFIVAFRAVSLKTAGDSCACELGVGSVDPDESAVHRDAPTGSQPVDQRWQQTAELTTSVQAAVESFFYGDNDSSGDTEGSKRNERLLPAMIDAWCVTVAGGASHFAASERQFKQWCMLPAGSDAFALSHSPHVEASSSVARAVRSLRAMGSERTPTRKLARLMESVQALSDHITLERPPSATHEVTTTATDMADSRVHSYASADNLLPLLIFAISRSRVQQLLVHCVAMQQLCVFASAHGERVYYLTMLEAALEFMQSPP